MMRLRCRVQPPLECEGYTRVEAVVTNLRRGRDPFWDECDRLICVRNDNFPTGQKQNLSGHKLDVYGDLLEEQPGRILTLEVERDGSLSAWPPPLSRTPGSIRCPVSICGKVYFINDVVGALGALSDYDRVVNVSRPGRFRGVAAIAPDGRGGLCAAREDRIYSYNMGSGQATALARAGVPSGGGRWGALAFDPAADALLAATSTAVCRVYTEGSGEMEVVAGDWEEKGRVDGTGAARFSNITALLPVSGGRLLIADGPHLRCMDAGGAVSTQLRGCFSGGRVRQLGHLPTGEVGAVMEDGRLLVVSGGDFEPAEPELQQHPREGECFSEECGYGDSYGSDHGDGYASDGGSTGAAQE